VSARVQDRVVLLDLLRPRPQDGPGNRLDPPPVPEGLEQRALTPSDQQYRLVYASPGLGTTFWSSGAPGECRHGLAWLLARSGRVRHGPFLNLALGMARETIWASDGTEIELVMGEGAPETDASSAQDPGDVPAHALPFSPGVQGGLQALVRVGEVGDGPGHHLAPNVAARAQFVPASAVILACRPQDGFLVVLRVASTGILLQSWIPHR